MFSKEENATINGVAIVRYKVAQVDPNGDIRSVSLYDADGKRWSNANYFTPLTWPFTPLNKAEIAFCTKQLPTSTWTVGFLKEYLDLVGTDYTAGVTKAELLALAIPTQEAS